EGAVAVGLLVAPGAGLDARIGRDEAAIRELELVVGEARHGELRGVVEALEMVRARLEHEHLEAELAAHVGGGAAARAAADHERVEMGQVRVADGRGAHENTFPPEKSVTVLRKSRVSSSSGAGSGPGFAVDTGASGRSRYMPLASSNVLYPSGWMSPSKLTI